MDQVGLYRYTVVLEFEDWEFLAHVGSSTKNSDGLYHKNIAIHTRHAAIAGGISWAYRNFMGS